MLHKLGQEPSKCWKNKLPFLNKLMKSRTYGATIQFQLTPFWLTPRTPNSKQHNYHKQMSSFRSQPIRGNTNSNTKSIIQQYVSCSGQGARQRNLVKFRSVAVACSQSGPAAVHQVRKANKASLAAPNCADRISRVDENSSAPKFPPTRLHNTQIWIPLDFVSITNEHGAQMTDKVVDWRLRRCMPNHLMVSFGEQFGVFLKNCCKKQMVSKKQE